MVLFSSSIVLSFTWSVIKKNSEYIKNHGFKRILQLSKELKHHNWNCFSSIVIFSHILQYLNNFTTGEQ